MSGLADSFREMWKTALTALGQLNTLVPAYWDGALDTALRVVRTALPLFAAVLLVQLVLLVFARRKRPRRILVFAGTLVVVLGLCVWACFPAWTAGGINGTPRGGGSVKGSMRGLLPEAIHRY